MLTAFKELGSVVAARWAAADRSLEAFPDIATTALSESRVLHTIERADIVTWLMRDCDIPEQLDNDFGQPPVKVYEGDRFRIEALFWIDSSTSVHQHAFAGAFGVLNGSSVHSTYRFEPQREVSPRVIAGRTEFLGAELLARGAVRAIQPGHQLIHSLFHLDRPSISIVVRTTKNQAPGPQYSYQNPYLALDPFRVPLHQKIQLRMLYSLTRSDRPGFWRASRDLVSTTSDPWLLYHALSLAYTQSEDTERWLDLLTHVNHNLADLLTYIIPCLRIESRDQRITHLRSTIHDPTHRFFLALLLNVPTRDEIYSLIAMRFPGDDPAALVVRWLSEIFSESRMGIKLTPSAVFLLTLMLADDDFERAQPAMRETFGEAAGQQTLRDAWTKLQAVDLFAPLFNRDMASVPPLGHEVIA
jgi:hypothetical protein